jgi:hypothetical protein
MDMKSIEASVTSTLGAIGDAIIGALEPVSPSDATASNALTPMVAIAPASLSSDDIASALPGLSAIIAWLAKNASAIELAAKDIPTIVALGQTVLPLLSTLAPLAEPGKPDDPVSTDDRQKYSRGR